MILRIIFVLVALSGVTGGPGVTIRPEADSAVMSAHPNSIPETAEETEIFEQVREELILGVLLLVLHLFCSNQVRCLKKLAKIAQMQVFTSVCEILLRHKG